MTHTRIILGPPGSGKTTALLEEVDEALKRGIAPDRIGFVTFTRRAAEEAVTRACAKFNLSRAALPYFRTLHSLCFRALGLGRGDVLDGPRLTRDFAEYAGLEMSGRWTEDGTFVGQSEGDRLLHMEHLARVRGVSLREQFEGDSDGLRWSRVEHAAAALARFKSANGLLDYTDMLSRFVAEAMPPRLEVLFVDECQDQSFLQWKVVHTLSKHTREVTVAGDDDQALFFWAGADVEHLINMQGEERVLGQSWRCPAEVQAVAMSLIARVEHRRPKEWAPREGRGEVRQEQRFDDVDLAGDWDAAGTLQPILVLARNEYVLREQVEPELRERGVIYERNGVSSVRPTVLEAIQAWEDLRAGRSVSVESALRAYALMTSGVGVRRGHKELPAFARGNDAPPVTMGDLRERGGLMTDAIWHDALDKMGDEERSYLLAARRAGESLTRRPRVRISTIHSAKGGEARHVVLLREMAPRTHREMERAPEDELRVWYVAVTRAQETLTVVGGQTRMECPWL